MRLGYDLQLIQTQKLIMTPELIQAIRILQYNSQELDTYIYEQLLANPVLEIDEGGERKEETADCEDPFPKEEVTGRKEGENGLPSVKDENFDWGEYIKESGYDDISYRHFSSGASESEYGYEQRISKDVSLAEYLMTQLQFIYLREKPCNVAKYIIEALDENGYLHQELEEIAAITGVSLKTAQKTLAAIQGFDPAGVGARDLKECLRLQLARRNLYDGLMEILLEDHLENIAQNKISLIAKDCGISTDEAQERCDLIRALEPKPGRQFGSSQDTRYIIADVNIEKVGEDYLVTLNEKSSPRLYVSPYYRKVLAESEEGSPTMEFLNRRMNSALWLIKSIEQRKRTIRSVVEAITEHQKGFFEGGPRCLRPMTLAEIASEVGIHESTVSRAISGKYAQTPKGLFELKYFFTGSLASGCGRGVAVECVKEFIRETVENEDPKSPLSDQGIVELLQRDYDVTISRRTVTKYRDELGIPSSPKRRRY